MIRKKHWGKNVGMRSLLVLSILISGVIMSWSINPASAADYPTKPVLFIAPSKPGSGFDTTARAVTATLGKEKLVPVAMPVENASSSIPGTATIVTRHKNNPYMIAVQSLAGMLNFSTGMSPYSHKDYTPIARLISAYYGIIVHYDSPYKTLSDLVKDLKATPSKIPFSGGVSDDRICYGAVFSKAGVDITKINYAAYGGGTEASTVILEGSGKVLISSIDDVMGLIEAKRLRPLAITSPKRMGEELKEYPTLREAGIDMEWENFRYILAGPAAPDYAVKYWQDVLAKMVKTPTWQEMMQKYRWGDTFLVEGLGEFLDSRQATVTDIVNKLGMGKGKK